MPRRNAVQPRMCIYVYTTGWPKKVSHYQESSLNHIKTTSAATFLINFEYKMNTRML